MADEILKNCPLCNKNARLKATAVKDDNEYWIECCNKDCGCETGIHIKDKVIELWNTRHVDTLNMQPISESPIATSE